MARFLKLKNMVINTAHITRIKHFVKDTDSSYLIYTNDLDLRGFNLFGFGVITNKDMNINVQLSQDPHSYHTVHKWIEDGNLEDFAPNPQL